jgi:thioredoxin 1
MKKLNIGILALSLLFFINCSNGQNAKTNVDANSFNELVNASNQAQLIDVRTPEEFAKGHLINALNFDWNGIEFDKQVSSLNKEASVFVYCLSGGRSAAAAAQLRSAGFKNVIELNGGIMKWRGANLPETTEATVQNTGMSVADFQKLTQSDKIVLIDFYADWCAPCKKMKPYLMEIQEELKASVVLIRINADDNQALCKSLKIDALPVLQVYKAGQLTWNQIGFVDKVTVLKQLK